MEKLPKEISMPNIAEFQAMSAEQKRIVILQKQQNDTFVWVKQAAMIIVISFAISIAVILFYLLNRLF